MVVLGLSIHIGVGCSAVYRYAQQTTEMDRVLPQRRVGLSNDSLVIRILGRPRRPLALVHGCFYWG